MNTLQIDYINEIASLTKSISVCNDAICSKNIEAWEAKEFKAVKKEYMKRKIQLIKILANPFIWN